LYPKELDKDTQIAKQQQSFIEREKKKKRKKKGKRTHHKGTVSSGEMAQECRFVCVCVSVCVRI
jgi:hypothetical protein